MMNNDVSVIDVKNRLWNLLTAPTDKMDFLANAERVLGIVDVTQGFWVELNYCYKVCEFADFIDNRCREYLGDCQHAMTIKRIRFVQSEAWAIRDRFYNLQSVRFVGVVSK